MVEPLALACDAMLGTLARWLRFAGFDVSYDATLDDSELAAQAREQGRWLLTRDRRLAAAAGPRVLLVRSGRLEEQIAEVRARLPLEITPRRAFSRCSRCNGVLREATPDEVHTRVPPYVLAHAPRFVVCDGCHRVYWPGTHTSRIARRIERLFGGNAAAGPRPE